MRIYISGPYSMGNMAQNVRKAIITGNRIARRGHAVFIPHLTHFWDLLIPNEYEFWIAQDLAWVEVCDAIFRMSGESGGADREVAHAQSLGKTVYYDMEEVPIEWK